MNSTPTIYENHPLQTLNTFGVAANARYFVTIHSVAALQTLLADPRWQKTPKFILGGGSNILLTDDFPGLVIKIEILGKTIFPGTHKLSLGAGEIWHECVRFALNHNLYGIENLSLIPGTVGAAPIQNIGAYGVELAQVLESVETLSLVDGKIAKFTATDCQFGYRDSIFKRELKNKVIITEVALQLNAKPNLHIEYGAIQQVLTQKNTPLTAYAVSDAIIEIRSSKLPDPAKIGNAGSFFKNPLISMALWQTLLARYPDMPHFPVDAQQVKIPAGWLIEKIGFKGRRVGNIGVHEHHALVLVNYGGGTGEQIWDLACHIQQAVHKQFGICLEAEVNRVPTKD